MIKKKASGSSVIRDGARDGCLDVALHIFLIRPHLLLWSARKTYIIGRTLLPCRKCTGCLGRGHPSGLSAFASLPQNSGKSHMPDIFTFQGNSSGPGSALRFASNADKPRGDSGGSGSICWAPWPPVLAGGATQQTLPPNVTGRQGTTGTRERRPGSSVVHMGGDDPDSQLFICVGQDQEA